MSYVVEDPAGLEEPEPDVGHAVPEDAAALLVLAVVAEAGHDARALGEQPGGDVLGQDHLDPHGEPEGTREEAHLGELVGADPVLGNLKGSQEGGNGDEKKRVLPLANKRLSYLEAMCLFYFSRQD